MRRFLDSSCWLEATAVALLAGAASLPATPARYSAGPPPAHTGGFGEPTCHSCHFDQPLDDPAGSLEVLGLPSRYEPGRIYAAAVVVSHPKLRRAGFQLSARYSQGDSAGRQAGQLGPSDRGAAVTGAGEPAVSYVHQTESGSLTPTPGWAIWTLDWRAPRSGQQVVFHLTANAANNDASELGDHVYTDSLVIPARSETDG